MEIEYKSSKILISNFKSSKDNEWFIYIEDGIWKILKDKDWNNLVFTSARIDGAGVLWWKNTIVQKNFNVVSYNSSTLSDGHIKLLKKTKAKKASRTLRQRPYNIPKR
jgi:hypothetical protein